MIRSTLILAVLAAGLWGVYNYYLKDNAINLTNDSPTPSIAAPISLVETTVDQIESVAWLLNGVDSGEIKKLESSWEFVRPITVQIDQTKASAFVQSIASLSGQSRIPLSEVSLGDAGLDKPGLKLLIRKSDGATDSILFGDLSVGDSLRYVHKEGTDYISLAYDYLYEELAIEPAGLALDPSPTPEAVQ